MRPFHSKAKIKGVWGLQCFDINGKLKWEDDIDPNLIVNEGLDYLLDVGLASGTQYQFWYTGLISTFTHPSGTAADTMASHSSWTEFTNYSGAVRKRWSNGAVSSQSIDNSGDPALFYVNVDDQTVNGAFLVGGVNSDVKNVGSGTLFAVGSFIQDGQSADNGDTLSLTATFSSADN